MKIEKILFLDIDGVCNSEETLKKSGGGLVGIDPYMALLVARIVEATDCKVVLSSSWRHSEENIKEVNKRVVAIHDKTGNCCSGIRGVEIENWIRKNISPEERKENFRYAILDDDSDMLLWQQEHFFKTSWKIGLTDEIANNVISYLNKQDGK